jgi:type I restriction enzyme, S subunit
VSELPGGWTVAPIGALTSKVGSGATPRGGGESYKSSGIPLIRSMNVINFGFKRDGLAYIDADQARALQNVEVHGGDVLLNITGASIGRVTLAPPDLQGARVNQHVCIIRPTDKLDARYLAAYLSSPGMQAEIGADHYGMTRPALTKQQILEFEVPIPPGPEQTRIADKLDSLIEQIRHCRARIDRVPEILNRFREAVLEAAVSGRLTEEWRGSPELTGWATKRAAEVCMVVQSGGTPKAGFTESSGVPFLKVYNIVGQHVAFDYRPQYVPSTTHEKELRKSRTLPGDVLMNIVGPPLGKVAVVPDTYAEWNINQAITLFRPGPEVSTQWIYAVLSSGRNVAEVIHQTRGSVGQVNISLSQCRNFDIPVPPPPEQAEIIRRLGELFALADGLQRRYQDSVTRIEKLTPSVLAKAFRGELVPQDPRDEPAGEMLERMLAHRTSPPK